METFTMLFNLLLKKNLIFNIFLEIIFLGVSLVVLQKIFKSHFSRKNILIYISINCLCFIISNLLINYAFSKIITLLCCILLSIYLLKLSALQTLSFFSLQSIVMLNLSFCLFKPLCIISASNSYFDVAQLPIFNIILIALITIIEFCIYWSQKNLKIDSILINTLSEKSNLLIGISTLNLVISLSIFFGFFEIFIKDLSYILLLNIYFYVSFSIAIAICGTKYLKQKIANLKLCNKTIISLHDDTRAFKHDFHNIIQAIGGYVYTNDMPGLKKYYTEILSDCNTLNNLSKLNPNLINNPAIYSILADKYFIANKNNIQMNFDVMTDLTELNINTYELSRILGILLDNAIEASKECTQKNINIFFKKDTKKKMLIIENTYQNKQISIDKIFEKDYSTKPNNTGLGLWEVRKILNKNNNLNLYTSKNDCYFSQQLEIYA